MNVPSLAVAKSGEKAFDLSKVLVFAPSIIAIAASVLIGFFVVWPKFGETLKLRESNKTLEATAVKLEDKAKALSALNVPSLKSQLAVAEQIVPSDKNIFPFLQQIENVRNDSGVVISNLSVGSVGQFKSGDSANTSSGDAGAAGVAGAAPPAPNKTDAISSAGASTVDMKLSVNSDYKSMLKFLSDIYSLPRVTVINELTFGANQSGQLTTNLTISSLWQAAPTQLPSVEAPLASISKADSDLLTKVQSTGAVSSPTVVPDVPKGKPDVFTPF